MMYKINMDINDAFSTPSIICEDTRYTKYANIEEAYDDMLQVRITNQNVQDKLEPCSLDSIKFANSFQQYNERHKTLCTQVEKLEQSLKDIHTDFTTMCNIAAKLQLEWNDDKTQEAWNVFLASAEKQMDILTSNSKKQIFELQKEMTQIENNMSSMRKCLLLGVQLLIPEDKATAHLCPVCFDQEVNMVLIPCGHTACTGCVKRIGDTCMTCRRRITSKHALFFSA